MTLDNSAQILVVILAAFLAVFLLLAILLIIFLIRVIKQIQSVTKVAQNTAEHVNSLVSTVSRAAAPAVTSKFIMQQVQRFMDSRQGKKKED
jgi:predicted PurR-regulated permease PerM